MSGEASLKLADIIYAILIKETQVALDSTDFSERFKKRIKEDRIEIKKKILSKLKKYSEEVAKKIQETKRWEGTPSEKANKLKNIIQGCMDEY